MSSFISNQQMPCSQCRATINGKEAEYNDFDGNLVHECQWVCGVCGYYARRDEVVTPKVKETPNK